MKTKNPGTRNRKEKIYRWITVLYFLFFLILRWVIDWKEFQAVHIKHNIPAYFTDFIIEMVRYMQKNWEAELLQLTFPAATLCFLLYVGPLVLKDADDSIEETIGHLIKKIDPENYSKIIKDWKEKFNE